MALNKKTYKWFYDHIHSHYYNLLVKWCSLPFGGEAKCREVLIAPVDFSPQERILDMCCGSGGATYSIAGKARRGSQIIGMDLSSGQIGKARQRSGLGNAQFIVNDAESISFRNNAFDKVFITHALHEMPRESRQRVLAETRRILRDKGTVIILELDNPGHLLVRLFIAFWFFYWLPFNFETATRRDMLEHGLTKEVEEAGFTHIRKTSNYCKIFQTVQGVK